MTSKLNDSQLNTIEQIEKFLNHSDGLTLVRMDKEESYKWIKATLVKFEYIRVLNKKEKGIVKRYIEKMTGYSRAQTTRLVHEYVKTGRIKMKQPENRNKFSTKYTRGDLILAAQTSRAHDNPNGAALKSLFRRAFNVYKDGRYRVLKEISVSYLYVIMKTKSYERIAGTYTKTKPTIVDIGERRKPDPKGVPGYLRVDSVHQGDFDRQKGVYHINIVDEVTQWQFVGSVPEINAKYTTIMLEGLVRQYPFVVREIHSDNGSEYINSQVSKKLTSLLIKLTKNRPRQTNDNALCESKHNIIRKWMGYGYIDKKMHGKINEFYQTTFNEYLNFHRCCGYATEVEDIKKKGKIKKFYKHEDYQTPYEKLRSIKGVERYLKEGVTIEVLDKLEKRYTDTEMAERVQEEVSKLQEVINQPVVFSSSGSFVD